MLHIFFPPIFAKQIDTRCWMKPIRMKVCPPNIKTALVCSALCCYSIDKYLIHMDHMDSHHMNDPNRASCGPFSGVTRSIGRNLFRVCTSISGTVITRLDCNISSINDDDRTRLSSEYDQMCRFQMKRHIANVCSFPRFRLRRRFRIWNSHQTSISEHLTCCEESAHDQD